MNKSRLTVCLAVFFFAAQPGVVNAYGPYHHGYHYGHHGYGGHIGIHHHGSDALGYAVLGLLGLYVISNIFSDNRRYQANRSSYPRYERVITPKVYNITPPTKRISAKENWPRFADDEGWRLLKQGGSNEALRVFAIQSQQDLRSGLPKIGFALAAARGGELERAVWSMRHALKKDPFALTSIKTDEELEAILVQLNQTYQSNSKLNIRKEDRAFMLATLAYLQKDYASAKTLINGIDESISTKNLRTLLR